jgi:hypothetical protein
MKTIKFIAALFMVASFFSCGNSLTPEELTKITQSNAEKQRYNDSMAVVQAKHDFKASVKKMSSKAKKIHDKYPDWDIEACELLAKRRVWIGMSYKMLVYLRGNPNHVNTSNYGNGIEYQACWDDYNPGCFYFGEDQIIKSYN